MGVQEILCWVNIAAVIASLALSTAQYIFFPRIGLTV
jgi:hypothetical protein